MMRIMPGTRLLLAPISFMWLSKSCVALLSFSPSLTNDDGSNARTVGGMAG